MYMKKFLFALFLGIACMFTGLAQAARYDKGDVAIYAYFYNDQAKRGMSFEEFNDADRRSKKTYLVLEGEFKAVYRVYDQEEYAKYNFHDPKAQSRTIGDIVEGYQVAKLKPETYGWGNLGVQPGSGRRILELPVGLYVVEYDYAYGGSVNKYYSYKGTSIGIGPGGVLKTHTLVALYAGKHLFFTKDKKFNSHPKAALKLYPSNNTISLFGTPGEKSRLIKIESLFREKSSNKRETFLTPYSLREMRVYEDKTKFGLNMIYKVEFGGLGYLLTFVEPKLHGWYSGLRAGDAIIAIKGMPNLTVQTAFKQIKEGATLIVKKFDSGETKEIVLKKKQAEPINPLRVNSAYIPSY